MRHTREYYIEAYRRGYRITRDGRLVNPNGDFIKGCYRSGNPIYLRFTIRVDNKFRQLYFHIFQAYIKYGDEIFFEKIQVRHKDNNSLNNIRSNILIGSNSDNQLDRSERSRSRSAVIGQSKLGKRVLSDLEVEEVRLLALQGNLSQRQIALMYNISKTALCDIINKTRRKFRIEI